MVGGHSHNVGQKYPGNLHRQSCQTALTALSECHERTGSITISPLIDPDIRFQAAAWPASHVSHTCWIEGV